MNDNVIPMTRNEVVHTPTPVNDVSARLDRIEQKVDRILSVIESTQTMVEKVLAEVMPTIESLASNPMIKALGIGGKFGRDKS